MFKSNSGISSRTFALGNKNVLCLGEDISSVILSLCYAYFTGTQDLQNLVHCTLYIENWKYTNNCLDYLLVNKSQHTMSFYSIKFNVIAIHINIYTNYIYVHV